MDWISKLLTEPPNVEKGRCYLCLFGFDHSHALWAALEEAADGGGGDDGQHQAVTTQCDGCHERGSTERSVNAEGDPQCSLRRQ